MLSSETPVSRPRPPAQMRRSQSMVTKSNASPPPPYVSAFVFPKPRKSLTDTLLGSPVVATYKRIEREASSPRNSISSEDRPDWLNERSREELSSLLVKADDVIKQRESELDRASTIVKSLYEDNVSLKTKHSGFFARFPRSDAGSPSSSPAPLSSFDSPQIYTNSLSRSSTQSSAASTTRHIRRISIHPDDLTLLSDQNAELIDKLKQLEAESANTEISGRRKLKQLEKEIASLRDDLEKTQLKSQEYEEQAQRMRPLEAALKRQVEREKCYKGRSPGAGIEEEDELSIRDFAPGGPLSRSPVKSFPKSASMPSSLLEVDETTPHLLTQSLSSHPVPFPCPDIEEERDIFDNDESAAVSTPEIALIAQLLAKMEELQEANASILARQQETDEKCQAMQREMESMNRVYDSLNDPRTELVQEDATSPPLQQGDSTIRFRSFRKTLDGNAQRPNLDDLLTTQKSRKSVMGLFDTPTPGPSKKSKGLSIPFETPSHRHTGSAESVMSPSLSSVHFSSSSGCSTPQELSPTPFHPESLHSELGDDWNTGVPFHRLRNTSLYSLGEYSAPPSPSPQPQDYAPHNFQSLFATEIEAYQREHGFKTPLMKASGLQLTLEPPTPERALDEASPSMVSATPSTPSIYFERQRRMSQTVRSRTHRWVNGRFTDSILGPSVMRKTSSEPVVIPEQDITVDTGHEKDGSDEGNRTPRAKRAPKSLLVVLAQPVMPRRLSDAFDNVIEKFHGHQRPASGSSTPLKGSFSDNEVPAKNDRAVEVFVDKTPVVESEKGLTKVMMEVWMWLQFGIIILVFIFAMAKKGPKSVLVNAEKRPVSRR